jgi:DNA-directed RNA polymerase subunit RPC12/RpoP
MTKKNNPKFTVRKGETMKELKCYRCGAEWTPRKENPVQCPRCKRVDYGKKEVKGGWKNE